MPRLHLIRHGRAAAGFDSDLDPGLDEVGAAQAAATADVLAPLGPLPLVSSPLRRCLETSAPLVAAWGAPAVVEPRVAEVPSTVPLAERSRWLRPILAGRWDRMDAEPAVVAWRDELLAALSGLSEDTVVVTHFVAINTVVGAATEDRRVTIFSPDNASVTVVDTDPATGWFGVVELGRQAGTSIG